MCLILEIVKGFLRNAHVLQNTKDSEDPTKEEEDNRMVYTFFTTTRLRPPQHPANAKGDWAPIDV